MIIYLTAVDDELFRAWSDACHDLPAVEFHRGDICDLDCDAFVAPTNSFACMSGGIDAHYLNRYGMKVQEEAFRIVREEFHGEMLVGQAAMLDLPGFQKLILAPTMRVPMILGPETVNPFLAARAALRAARAARLESVAFPGLGTGVGQVPAKVCARQMRAAIQSLRFGDPEFRRWKSAQTEHQLLYTDSPRDLQFPT